MTRHTPGSGRVGIRTLHVHLCFTRCSSRRDCPPCSAPLLGRPLSAISKGSSAVAISRKRGTNARRTPKACPRGRPPRPPGDRHRRDRRRPAGQPEPAPRPVSPAARSPTVDRPRAAPSRARVAPRPRPQGRGVSCSSEPTTSTCPRAAVAAPSAAPTSTGGPPRASTCGATRATRPPTLGLVEAGKKVLVTGRHDMGRDRGRRRRQVPLGHRRLPRRLKPVVEADARQPRPRAELGPDPAPAPACSDGAVPGQQRRERPHLERRHGLPRGVPRLPADHVVRRLGRPRRARLGPGASTS